jgi:hypothetical protein
MGHNTSWVVKQSLLEALDPFFVVKTITPIKA